MQPGYHFRCATTRFAIAITGCLLPALALCQDAGVSPEEGGLSVRVLEDWCIQVTAGPISFDAATSLDNCIPKKHKWRTNSDGEIEEWKRIFSNKEEDVSCLLEERLGKSRDGIDWTVEVVGESGPWSTPIETVFHFEKPEGLQYWTAWSDPEGQSEGWRDPLVMRSLEDRTFYYAAPPFTESDPKTGYCPVQGNTFCIPMITVVDPGAGRGVSIILSPQGLILDLVLTLSADGTVRFSRLNHRIESGRTVWLGVNIIAHEADWRPGLAWMVRRYSEYFEPRLAAADTIAGLGAYSATEEKLDACKYLRMGFRVNWKASFDFPYMGMFLPPVADDETPWPRFAVDSRGQSDASRISQTSMRGMRDYSANMRAQGFHVLNYFNVTEFGTDIKGPESLRQDLPDDRLWESANDFLHRRIADGILKNRAGSTWGTWGGAIAMDPAGADYQAHLLEQARRHIEELPDSAGICIDRLDWLRFYNPHADDGVSWHEGMPARSLVTSWHGIMEQLAPIMHDAGKVIFVNNHLKRIDLLKNVDGIYCEFAQRGPALNSTGLLGVARPTIGWTASVDDLKPDPDALMQRHLHMGVFPTAPIPGNDHTIGPDAWAEQYYLDYGPLFDALRGKRWVLQAHAIQVEGNKAKVNLFDVPGGLVAPVTFAGEAQEAIVRLRNWRGLLPDDVAPRIDPTQLNAEVLHPGSAASQCVRLMEAGQDAEVAVGLVRGCAMLRIFYRSMMSDSIR